MRRAKLALIAAVATASLAACATPGEPPYFEQPVAEVALPAEAKVDSREARLQGTHAGYDVYLAPSSEVAHATCAVLVAESDGGFLASFCAGGGQLAGMSPELSVEYSASGFAEIPDGWTELSDYVMVR